MSKQRTIGIVRDWPRHPAKRQEEALRAAGATIILTIPHECATWRDAVRFVRKNDRCAVTLIQLLPEPKSAEVRHPAMDGRDAIEEIERRGSHLVETSTGRSSADPKQRRDLIDDMARSVGAGGRSLSSAQARANGSKSRSRGRPKAEFTPEQIEAARSVWMNRKIDRWNDAAKLLPKGFTVWRARALFGSRGSRTSEPRSPDQVYFARAGRTNRVKIGTAVDVAVRMRDLAHPLVGKLRVLGVVDGGYGMESEMHRRFAVYRIKGEWFRLEGELAEFVASLSKSKPK